MLVYSLNTGMYISDIAYLLNKTYEFLTLTGGVFCNIKAIDLYSKYPFLIIHKVYCSNPSVTAKSYMIVRSQHSLLKNTKF
jgi:hypothetical protein